MLVQCALGVITVEAVFPMISPLIPVVRKKSA